MSFLKNAVMENHELIASRSRCCPGHQNNEQASHNNESAGKIFKTTFTVWQ